MSRKKKILFFILIFTAALILFGMWYKYEYSMDIAEAIQVNPPNQSKNLLIATQGSPYKDAITTEIIEHFKNDSIAINVIDVSLLEHVDCDDYSAILLVHTWENWKPPTAVEQFVNKLSDQQKRNVVIMTTSGRGNYKMDNVDAITGESDLNNVASVSNQIIERLTPLLKSKMQ